ncbi:MAG TPA: glycosyltransferase [Ardenticatenaceae bacterium]|nr:glycosyltransferase [Ardenticatenaceae bacterium]
MTTVAVVLISKNQAWNTGRLVESVLRETATLPSIEVVLVDSASTDETAEVAARYPIDVLRLRPDQQLTPAAGRYVGSRHATADLVLFLDGDMELAPGWLAQAVRVMDASPDVGVLTGQVIDLLPTAGPEQKPLLPDARSVGLEEIPYSGGAAMYRRAALDEVGTFNPYLHSDEEPELCIRIRHAGYRVVRLAYPIAYHYSSPGDALSTLVARWRRKLYLGSGEAIRYHLGSDLLWPYLRERGFGLIPGVGLAAGLLAWLVSLTSGQQLWFRLWLLLLLGLIAADALRKRSLYRTVHSLTLRLLVLDGTIRGFLATPHDPRSYPAQFDVIRGATRGSVLPSRGEAPPLRDLPALGRAGVSWP